LPTFYPNSANLADTLPWSVLWFFFLLFGSNSTPGEGARPKVPQYQRRLPGEVIMHCASIKRPLWLQCFSDIFLHNYAIFAKALLSGGTKFLHMLKNLMYGKKVTKM
jgi:hypothetical protein